MSASRFSAGELLGFGWEKAKERVIYFLGIFILITAANFLVIFLEHLAGNINGGTFFTDALSCFIDLVFGAGLIKVALTIYDNKHPSLMTFISSFDIFLNYAVGFILYSLIIVFGIILLVIPGVIWSIQFQFFGHFIVDKHLGPVEALKESARITQGIKMPLFGFGVLLGLTNLLGAIVFGIGLLFSVPTTIIAHAALYKKLSA